MDHSSHWDSTDHRSALPPRRSLTILLSANRHNFDACVDLAIERGLGIEVMALAYPDALHDEAHALHTAHALRTKLDAVPGKITMHGAFIDMVSGSPDPLILEMTLRRYRQAIELANIVGAETLILHANFIASMRDETYRTGWHRRNLPFWSAMADEAAEHNVTLAIENMWEFDPCIIGDLLAAIDHPHLRACVDVGHAHLFSTVPFEQWLSVLAPFIVHTHLNNNDGKDDTHRPFSDGVLDYETVLPMLRALPFPPSMTLEMDTVADMRASLPYFDALAVEPSRRRAKSDTAEMQRAE